MAEAVKSGVNELIFAVDVAAFTKKGFIGSSNYSGHPVEIEFDDADLGVFLAQEMGEKLHVRKASKVTLVVDTEERPQVTESVVAGVGKKVCISSARVYYQVGRDGGAVVRIRKSEPSVVSPSESRI